MVLVLFVFVNCANAYNYRKVTDDDRIVAALKVLEDTNSQETLERIFNNSAKHPVQIIFYDLGMISYEYKNHFATVSDDNFGDVYIIIHTAYRNAPKEALAALIAHEAVHLAYPTENIDNEVKATSAEALQWSKCLAKYPNLKFDSTNLLIARLNGLVEIYNTAGAEGIDKKITSNPFYAEHFSN